MRSRPLFELLGGWRISLSYYFITVLGARAAYSVIQYDFYSSRLTFLKGLQPWDYQLFITSLFILIHAFVHADLTF